MTHARTAAGQRVESTISCDDPAQVWLALSVLGRVVATESEVVATMRSVRRTGGDAVVEAVADRLGHGAAVEADDPRIVVGATVVDVTQAVSTHLVTGIQRVVLETVRRWAGRHPVLPVTWSDDLTVLRQLTHEEAARIGQPGHDRPAAVVPWRGTLLLPEVADRTERIARTHATVRYAGCRTGAIGYDCVPLTSPETAQTAFAPVFFRHLHVSATGRTRVAAISAAAAREYRGWRSTLSLAGFRGPEVLTVPLAEVAPDVPPEEVDAARRDLARDGLPLVLAVGSHEPRKNHLTLLHAAELRWQAGDRFALAFVGGNAWSDEAFQREVRLLLERGRTVSVVAKLPDGQLWAAYRAARFTVFPSLNEGFGLPVAESLAAGTPVITSGFGSMAEIAAGGGAVVVDPHDPRAVAAAMAALLHDDVRLDRLRQEAADRPRRSWDTYAEEAWQALTGDRDQG